MGEWCVCVEAVVEIMTTTATVGSQKKENGQKKDLEFVARSRTKRPVGAALGG